MSGWHTWTWATPNATVAALLAGSLALGGCGKKAADDDVRPSAQKTGDYGDNPNLPAEPAAGEPGRATAGAQRRGPQALS